MAPEPAQLQPEPPAVAPEPELPAPAPAEKPEAPASVLDYFAAEAPASPAPETAPVEEPAPAVELSTITPMAPEPAPAPAEQPAAAVELPTMAPPELEAAPAAVVASEPVELQDVAPEPVEVRPMAPEPELPTMAPEPAIHSVPEPVEVALPVIEPVAIVETTPADTPAPELEELFAAQPQRTAFNVVVRLRDGDGVEVGSFRDFGTAMEGAQEVIEQFSTATEGRWPFYAGRFIRPDLIVSVDVVEGESR
jgi:hypothetical protein